MKMEVMELDPKINAMKRKKIKINRAIILNRIRIDSQLSQTAANIFK